MFNVQGEMKRTSEYFTLAEWHSSCIAKISIRTLILTVSFLIKKKHFRFYFYTQFNKGCNPPNYTGVFRVVKNTISHFSSLARMS